MAKSPDAAAPRRGANPALRLAAIRRWHSWMGVFIAPSVIFFAFTGVIQIFSLHEARGGYHPPALIEGMGAVHKDQVFRLKPPRPAAAPVPAPSTAQEPAPKSGGHHHDGDAGHDDADPEDGDHAGPAATSAPSAPADKAAAKPKGQPIKVYALKWFFTLVAVGLIASTSLGLWMALAYGRDKRALWIALAVGTIVPVLLVVA